MSGITFFSGFQRLDPVSCREDHITKAISKCSWRETAPARRLNATNGNQGAKDPRQEFPGGFVVFDNKMVGFCPVSVTADLFIRAPSGRSAVGLKNSSTISLH